MKTVYTITTSIFSPEIEVGKVYTLVSRENTLTGVETWHLYDYDGDGMPGNLDASKKRYHGWRGTTNNISVYAHVRRVLEVRSCKVGSLDCVYRVKLGPDEAEGLE